MWVVDGVPSAWSFHYLNVVKKPKGFPPSPDDLRSGSPVLEALWGRRSGPASSSLDFARLRGGELGPSSRRGRAAARGTGREAVSKAVASRLQGVPLTLEADRVGGPL